MRALSLAFLPALSLPLSLSLSLSLLARSPLPVAAGARGDGVAKQIDLGPRWDPGPPPERSAACLQRAALRVVRTPPPELGASWSLSWLKPWSADAACHEAHGAELLSGTPFNNSTGDLVSIGAVLATRLLATEMYSYTVVRVIKLPPSPPQARNFWRY